MQLACPKRGAQHDPVSAGLEAGDHLGIEGLLGQPQMSGIHWW